MNSNYKQRETNPWKLKHDCAPFFPQCAPNLYRIQILDLHICELKSEELHFAKALLHCVILISALTSELKPPAAQDQIGFYSTLHSDGIIRTFPCQKQLVPTLDIFFHDPSQDMFLNPIHNMCVGKSLLAHQSAMS